MRTHAHAALYRAVRAKVRALSPDTYKRASERADSALLGRERERENCVCVKEREDQLRLHHVTQSAMEYLAAAVRVKWPPDATLMLRAYRVATFSVISNVLVVILSCYNFSLVCTTVGVPEAVTRTIRIINLAYHLRNIIDVYAASVDRGYLHGRELGWAFLDVEYATQRFSKNYLIGGALLEATAMWVFATRMESSERVKAFLSDMDPTPYYFVAALAVAESLLRRAAHQRANVQLVKTHLEERIAARGRARM